MAVAAAASAINGGGGRRERRRGAGDGDGVGGASVGRGGHDVAERLISFLSRRVRRRSGGDTSLRCHPHTVCRPNKEGLVIPNTSTLGTNNKG